MGRKADWENGTFDLMERVNAEMALRYHLCKYLMQHIKKEEKLNVGFSDSRYMKYDHDFLIDLLWQFFWQMIFITQIYCRLDGGIMKISLHQTEQPSAFLSTFVYASFLHRV